MREFQVKVRALCSATESEEKVVLAMRNVLNLERIPDAKIARLTGVFGEPLSVIEVELSGEDAARAAKYIISKLDKRYIRERTESGKAFYTLHARIDKQTAYHGVVMTTEEDPIKVEIRTAVNPLILAERNLNG
ncbi:MAG: RNA-binding domain-containing protein [Nitrososphaerota archaeon]